MTARKMLAETQGAVNSLARSWEGEPPGEPRRNPARTEPRPPGITQDRLDTSHLPNSSHDFGQLLFARRETTDSRTNHFLCEGLI